MTRLACLAILASVATASAETLEDVEKKLTEKFQKHTSLSADMKMTMQMAPGMSAESAGTMEFMLHDGKERFRSEIKMTMSHSGQTMESHMVSTFDGENAYTINEMMGQKQVIRTKPSQVAGRAGGSAFWADLKRENTLTLLPDENVDGAPTYVVQGTPKQPLPQGPSSTKYYFDKSRGMMIKMVGLNTAGETLMSVTITNIKLNPKLDPSRFEFKPEPGTNVIDMTGR